VTKKKVITFLRISFLQQSKDNFTTTEGRGDKENGITTAVVEEIIFLSFLKVVPVDGINVNVTNITDISKNLASHLMRFLEE
jgi:hypothetical protein